MVFKFYLLSNEEIIIYGYDHLSDDALNILDEFVCDYNCKREDNIITGDPADLMDVLVAVSDKYNILLGGF